MLLHCKLPVFRRAGAAKLHGDAPDRVTCAVMQLQAHVLTLFRNCCRQVGGLSTNQAFLRRLAAHPAFAAAELDTAFIARHGAELTAMPNLAPEVAALALLAAHTLRVHAVRLR